VGGRRRQAALGLGLPVVGLRVCAVSVHRVFSGRMQGCSPRWRRVRA
jgi:hypothetical protein